MSYIYMKILESRPRRYDLGISLLSLGQADRAKKRMVEELVRPGMSVLEIGCGTGALAAASAEKGAKVLGFDVSPAMLEVAREKQKRLRNPENLELREMGVSRMDELPDSGFDLVLSTLVFSELSKDEQAYALRHSFRVLKPGGKLAIADETTPGNPLKRAVYHALRVPLLVITFALTQTTTRPVSSLKSEVEAAGFHIETYEESALGSFFYLTARKP